MKSLKEHLEKIKANGKKRTEKMIAKGKWHSVCFYGVLGWGLPVGLTLKFSHYYFDGKPFFDNLLTHAVIWSIAGIVFGLFMWSYINYSHKKSQQE